MQRSTKIVNLWTLLLAAVFALSCIASDQHVRVAPEPVKDPPVASWEAEGLAAQQKALGEIATFCQPSRYCEPSKVPGFILRLTQDSVGKIDACASGGHSVMSIGWPLQPVTAFNVGLVAYPSHEPAGFGPQYSEGHGNIGFKAYEAAPGGLRFGNAPIAELLGADPLYLIGKWAVWSTSQTSADFPGSVLLDSRGAGSGVPDLQNDHAGFSLHWVRATGTPYNADLRLLISNGTDYVVDLSTVQGKAQAGNSWGFEVELDPVAEVATLRVLWRRLGAVTHCATDADYQVVEEVTGPYLATPGDGAAGREQLLFHAGTDALLTPRSGVASGVSELIVASYLPGDAVHHWFRSITNSPHR